MTLIRSGCLYSAALAACLLAGCATAPLSQAPVSAGETAPSSRGGGFYLNDGPPDLDGRDLAAIPDAVPHAEPLSRAANRPYHALGRLWVPQVGIHSYTARGIASWYGRRYQGHRVATGEVYDPFAMTAAHPTLPIPCYVRVTNLNNGRSVVVRVNDRGPFLRDRLIDLSYVAAWKLGFAGKGSAPVQVDLIDPAADAPPPAADATPPTAATAGLWLQLGVFASVDNARALQARVQAQLGDSAEPVEVQDDGARYRVCSGPFASRDQAQAAARRVTALTGVRPVLIALP